MKRLKDNRSILLSFLFVILTLGIYDIYLHKVIARDTNIACNGDGRKTAGAFKYILFSILTLGIYSIVWEYKLLTRWKIQAENNGEQPVLSPNTYLIIAIILYYVGIGIVISYGVRIMGLNKMCSLYNESLPEEKVDPSKNNWGWKF